MILPILIISLILQYKASERSELDDQLSDYTSYNVGGGVMQLAPSLNAIDVESSLFRSLSDEMGQTGSAVLPEEMAQDYVENTNLVSTTGDVIIHLDLKKRGLRYEPTYETEFSAVYVLTNTSNKKVAVEFEFPFPTNVLNKEINHAQLLVDGVVQEKPARTEEVDTSTSYEYPVDYPYGDYTYTEETATKSGLYWEGIIEADGQKEVEVRYTTVGLGVFSYVGLENPGDSQDFAFSVKVLGSRKYDNSGSLTIDEREYIAEDGQNGVFLTWDKPDLFSTPDIEISVAPRVNPSQHLGEIYKIIVPLYIGFAGAIILLVSLSKRDFGGVDMIIFSALFTVFFPFLHYLVSFNVDPSADVLANYSGTIDFSMPLYGAFVISLGVVGGLMMYLFAKVSGARFAFGVGLPLILVFMAFFPLAMTLPEYKYLLALIGIVAILGVVVQMRVSRKMTHMRT